MYAKQSELPIIGCCCPACGDLGLQRQRAKRLIMELETEHPGVKQSMLKALANVAPRHLLDMRLNPPAELRASPALVVTKDTKDAATKDTKDTKNTKGTGSSPHVLRVLRDAEVDETA